MWFVPCNVHKEEEDCFHKTWHIRIEIVSNGCNRISFKDTHREKAHTNKTPAPRKYEYGHLGSW